MALQTSTTIKIGDILITNFSNLKIEQKIHDHNTFSVAVRQDLLVSEFKSVMPVSQRLYGERVSIEVKPIEGLEDLLIGTDPKDYILHFSGIVTQIEILKSRFEDLEETIFISGHSCSILLDDGPRCNCFTQKTLSDIVQEAKTGYDIDMNVFAFYKNNLPYTVQYNQSTFEFLNNLAKRNGHWFYDNGRTMVFGAPGTAGGEPKLVYGANMQFFTYKMIAVPALFEVLDNDHRAGNYLMDQIMQYRNECSGFQQNFLNKSTTVFNQIAQMQLHQNAVGGRLEEYAKNKMREVLGNMMEVTARSEVPGITLGNTVQIRGVDVQLESTYCVTGITHQCEDEGSYQNHFTAINFNGSVFSPLTNPDLVPQCKSQTAIVTANADPGELSYVQVQMSWQKERGKTTPYVPLLVDYGGNNRGSHIIPEIGDLVYVEFMAGNAELPIVKGVMKNLSQKSAYSTLSNDLKVWATRSGNKLIMNDGAGSILLEDAANSHIDFDGNGNIHIKADTLNIDVKQLIINAAESTQITTNDYLLNALSKIYITSKQMKQVIRGLMSMFSGKALINSSDTIDIEAKEVKVHGKNKALVHSDEQAILNSLGTVKMHAAEGNNFTNRPEKVEAVPTEAVALAVICFRPSPLWEGKYGFDWLRENDNGLAQEPAYETIIEGGYKDGIINLTKTEAFEKLKKEYEIIPIERKDATAGTTEYFVPYLTLFSKEFVEAMPATTFVKPQYEAVLRMLFDIQEDLEKLEFEYDETLFKLSSKKIHITTKTNGLENKNTMIKITCLKDLDCDHDICIYAYPKKDLAQKTAPTIEDRKLAGKVKVLRNDSAVRREEKIVLVKTSTFTDPEEKIVEGQFSNEEKKNLYDTLHQALIIPIVEETTLDLSDNTDFRIGGKHLVGMDIKYSSYNLNNEEEKNYELYDDCKKAFEELKNAKGEAINEKYKEYFLVFKFGIKSSENGVAGAVKTVGIRNVILYTLDANDDCTLNHEILHGLKLNHTHRDHSVIPNSMPNYKYTFPNATANPINATNNVMSYRFYTYYIWYWQWKIINSNIK